MWTVVGGVCAWVIVGLGVKTLLFPSKIADIDGGSVSQAWRDTHAYRTGQEGDRG